MRSMENVLAILGFVQILHNVEISPANSPLFSVFTRADQGIIYLMTDDLSIMTYPTFTHEELIVDWFKRSQKQRARRFTIFDQFISLWFAFNSLGTYLSKKDKDSEMLRWIKAHTDLPAIHKTLIKNDPQFLQRIKRLADYTVLDMRPGHKGESKSISDLNSLDELLDVIYQIRCNLFHGQKSRIDPRDRELVEVAFYILSKMFKPIVDEPPTR